MRCADCKFWLAKPTAFDETAGDCRRRAPAPQSEAASAVLAHLARFGQLKLDDDGLMPDVADHYDRQARWPSTQKDDFCGEFLANHGASFV